MTNPTSDPQEGAPLCVTCGHNESKHIKYEAHGKAHGPLCQDCHQPTAYHPFVAPATAGSAAPSVEEARGVSGLRRIIMNGMHPDHAAYLPQFEAAVRAEWARDSATPALHAAWKRHQAKTRSMYRLGVCPEDKGCEFCEVMTGAEWAQGAQAFYDALNLGTFVPASGAQGADAKVALAQAAADEAIEAFARVEYTLTSLKGWLRHNGHTEQIEWIDRALAGSESIGGTT